MTPPLVQDDGTVFHDPKAGPTIRFEHHLAEDYTVVLITYDHILDRSQQMKIANAICGFDVC